ncbi:hypothetical protein TrST_g10608 [Triparma strigata]|uniref:Uncharacterized protein n=1 Tax=Triparma strigata TaxID=1606541 RepID=A0A9W7B1U9_9STRA|nr:hypothetical protein TrST_g10608 [Triparma strigata]
MTQAAFFLLPFLTLASSFIAPLSAQDGLDAEADTVGPGIYGGRVKIDASGDIVIGAQYEMHMSLPGPVYDGNGYTELSSAIRTGVPETVKSLLNKTPEMVNQVQTGYATPLHVSCMSELGQQCTAILLEFGAEVDAKDAWGYTSVQRAAISNLEMAVEALLKEGADHNASSGLEDRGESTRDFAKKYRSFKVLKVIQDYEENELGISLPEGEYRL